MSHSLKVTVLRAMPFKTGVRAVMMIFLILDSASCIHNGVVRGPDTPMALQTGKKVNKNVMNEIQNFYYNRCLEDSSTLPIAPLAAPSPNCGSRIEQRNTIIYNLKSIIDNNYEDYARHFEITADTASFAGEVSAASLTAVGTLVGASDLKNILTTASTLTQSTTLSLQKNYFQKQTEYAIVSEMDADRKNQWSVILQLTSKTVDDYPLSQALNDLQQYKRAGTAVAALTAITQQAGAQTQNADQKVKKTLKVE